VTPVRYVDMSGLSAPPEWIDRARRAMETVRIGINNGTDVAFRELWREDAVRGLLLRLVGLKCWYCETVIQRTDVQVDHFRPKSEVFGEPAHPGYWWLAYELANYRVICKHCNSGGARLDDVPLGRAKSSRFPLLTGTRAMGPRDDLTLEQPVLLDPAWPGDPELIGFDVAGCARRRSGAPYSPGEAGSGLCRADETIRILALNATQITEQRRKLMAEIGVLARLTGIDEVEELIAGKVGPEAPWSSAASAALAMHRAGAVARQGIEESVATSAGASASVLTRSSVDLVDLLPSLDPDDLAVGIALTGRLGGREYHAELQQDGRINAAGRTWATPHSAARAVTGKDDVNGWEFWRLVAGGREVSLEDFRATRTGS